MVSLSSPVCKYIYIKIAGRCNQVISSFDQTAAAKLRSPAQGDEGALQEPASSPTMTMIFIGNQQFVITLGNQRRNDVGPYGQLVTSQE